SMADMLKAMKAFSPMYGATAIGRLAYSPISSEPNTAASTVATVLGPRGMPANSRIAGLTTMMYAIVRKVVAPPSSSVRTVVPCSDRPKKRSRKRRTLGYLLRGYATHARERVRAASVSERGATPRSLTLAARNPRTAIGLAKTALVRYQ